MFPPEIVDHVLSFLQWDHATLKVCARAHPSLSSLVNQHLYRHLTVHQNYGPCPAGAYHFSDLLKLFVDYPYIANLVRSLQINVDFCRDYQALESILPMLTQLQSISLYMTYSITRIIWDSLRESFRTGFTNCLRLPTLTHVKLILLGIKAFPLSTLDSSSLKSLSLSGDFCYIPPTSPLVYPPLDYLNLTKYSSTSMEIITSWLESRNLRSLQLRESSLERSLQLVGRCANTLTTLIVNVPFAGAFSGNLMPIPFSFSCLPHLARLTIQTPISSARPNFFSTLPTTMQLLDTLPSPPTNLVLLVISVEIEIGTLLTLSEISDTNWSPLMSFPFFDVIPRVELRVRAQKSGKQIPSSELLGELKQHPRLMQLEMHQSFVINAAEESDDNGPWFHHFISD